MRERLRIYTDGACSGNPGPGGWAWITPGGPFAAGAAADTTNQRMELQAALEAVTANVGPLRIVSDSTYVVNCFRDRWWEGWIKRGWVNSAKKPVANRDLWEPLIEAVQAGDVEFEWVKGHAGDEWNDYADRLAVEAAMTQMPRRGDTTPTEIGEPDKTSRGRSQTHGSGSGGSTSRAGADPTGREAPPGRRLVVLGLRPKELGGFEDSPVHKAVRARLAQVIEAKAAMYDDLIVLSGVRLGTEMLGAEAAIEVGVRLVVVLPYPDPHKPWTPDNKDRFLRICEAAEDVLTLQGKAPKDTKAAWSALARRDAWFARNVEEALVVWDGAEADVGRTIRTMQDSVGEDEVWVVELSEL